MALMKVDQRVSMMVVKWVEYWVVYWADWLDNAVVD